jgi:hypothetical protein
MQQMLFHRLADGNSASGPVRLDDWLESAGLAQAAPDGKKQAIRGGHTELSVGIGFEGILTRSVNEGTAVEGCRDAQKSNSHHSVGSEGWGRLGGGRDSERESPHVQVWPRNATAEQADRNQTENSPARPGRPCSLADGIHNAVSSHLCFARIHICGPRTSKRLLECFGSLKLSMNLTTRTTPRNDSQQC